MPALWIAQLLCPMRHAICALAYDLEETPAADIEEKLNMVITERVGGIDPWCGLCGSRHLHIEHAKLPSDDWEEMIPRLKATEQDNLRTRDMLRRSDN